MLDFWHASQISVSESFASRYSASLNLAPKRCWNKHMDLIEMLNAVGMYKCHSLSRSARSPSSNESCRRAIKPIVLRITITDLSDEQRWSLQGGLVGAWATELKSRWREVRQAGEARKCIVELIEVTSIDRNGEAVLAEIMSQGCEFIASDVYTKHVLRSLRSELKRSRIKGKQDGGGNH